MMKMSVLEGMTGMITQLKQSIDSEKDNLERDVSSAINKIASETGRAFDQVFTDIKDALKDAGEFVENDFQALEKLLDKVVRKIESTAESEYHGFQRRVETVVHDVEKVARTATSEIAHATEYIRTKAYEEFDSAITNARKDFERAKTDFKGAVESMASSLVSKTRSGIRTLVTSAQHDLEAINALRKDIDADLKAHVKDIENELVSLKDKASADLDKISSFMRTELNKMEARVAEIKSTINSIAFAVGAASLIGAVAIAFGMFAYGRSQQATSDTRMQANVTKAIKRS